jgi:phenol/toluene 2-monooxygenase (NADH) P1/A1
MQIDIKAKELKPIRHTFTHIAKRIGGDKPATRYQEAVFDVQATDNFHYRPTWQPDKELYDESRTALVMEDWYKFLDPRQYYYGNYCMVRAKQQESAEQNFKFVEKRNLLGMIPETTRQLITNVVVPLRHYEWAANMNNTQVCAMGYGSAITSAAMLHAGDRLGNAQYITRIGLALEENDPAAIDKAKAAWMDDANWQGLRKLVEDSLVVEDWFELFLLQNLVMDGLIHPLIFQYFENEINQQGASSYSMLTEFMVEWYAESARWVDKQIAVACAESEQNKQLVSSWFESWLGEAVKAVQPLAELALENGAEVMQKVESDLITRAIKNGIQINERAVA